MRASEEGAIVHGGGLRSKRNDARDLRKKAAIVFSYYSQYIL